MSNGYVQLNRSRKTDELMKESPNAFMLLTLIALRARREESGFNPHNLSVGEAMLGDPKSVGMSEQEYRTAKKQLERWDFATFRATNRGSLGKLTDSSIYNINADQGNGLNNGQLTGKQRTTNGQLTTKKNEEEGKEDKKEAIASKRARPSREEFDTEVTGKLGMTANDAEHVWNVWEENGWTRSQGGKRIPISNWRLALNTWKTGGYFPSQKNGNNGHSKNGHAKPATPDIRAGIDETKFLAWYYATYPPTVKPGMTLLGASAGVIQRYQEEGKHTP